MRSLDGRHVSVKSSLGCQDYFAGHNAGKATTNTYRFSCTALIRRSTGDFDEMEVLPLIATLAGGLWALLAAITWVRRQLAKPLLPVYSATDLRRRLKMLVIDDAGFTYFEDFKRDAFNIESWPRVEAYAHLEGYQYDVLVLDIHGIAGHLSARDGLGVAEYVRGSTESMAIIIYSGATYQLTVDTSSADVVFDVAGGDYDEFRSHVDQLYARMTTPEFYLRNFNSGHGSSVTDEDRKALEGGVRQALTTGKASTPGRYSDHVTASRAAEVMRHAAATAARLHRMDV